MKRDAGQIPPKWLVRVVSLVLFVIGAFLVFIAITNFHALGWSAIFIALGGIVAVGFSSVALYTGEPEWILLDLIIS